MPDAYTSPQGSGILPMNENIELSTAEYQRLMDALLWVLGPYLESDDPLSEHPHLFELAECYSELYHKCPTEILVNYPQICYV